MNEKRGFELHPNYDYKYDAELREKFQARKPKKVFDAHFHLSPNEIPGVPSDEIFDEWFKLTEDYVGHGTLSGGLLMGNPKLFETKAKLDEDREYGCELAAAHEGFVSGLVTRPIDSAEDVVDWLGRYNKIVAIKPYRNYALGCDDYKQTFEADITSYAPEWMWEVAQQYGLVMMIHLSHYYEMLRDPRNGEQIRYLSRKYPNTKIILAHCAMGHHPPKMKDGLKYLEGLDNIWMDCSGISEALSILYAIRELGHERMLYGTDGYCFGDGNNGRCIAAGGNFFGIYCGLKVSMPADYNYAPIRNIAEGLQALYAAGDILGLTQDQYDDIFYNNSANLFYPIIRK